MVNILIGCTGSVATIKLPILLQNILDNKEIQNCNIRVIVTERAQHFYNKEDIPSNIPIYTDADEWSAWHKRGDPVLHIELGKWSDLFLIAPLDANTLAKVSTGLCDNLLTCTVRAWDLNKPLLFCPAMNTRMFDHPLTHQQISTLQSWGYRMIPVVSKTLMCGETGSGGMAEVPTIVEEIQNIIIKM